MDVIDNLKAYRPSPASYQLWTSTPHTARSAVLVLLFWQTSSQADPSAPPELHVLVTVRSSQLRTYPGQAAFPGGRCEARESSYQTARRETAEEIGLPDFDSNRLPSPYRIDFLCHMPLVLSRDLILVRPCVAFLHHAVHPAQPVSWSDFFTSSPSSSSSPVLSVNPNEVQTVFSLPLRHVLASTVTIPTSPPPPSDHKPQADGWYSGQWTLWRDAPWRHHCFHVDPLRWNAELARATKQAQRQRPFPVAQSTTTASPLRYGPPSNAAGHAQPHGSSQRQGRPRQGPTTREDQERKWREREAYMLSFGARNLLRRRQEEKATATALVLSSVASRRRSSPASTTTTAPGPSSQDATRGENTSSGNDFNSAASAAVIPVWGLTAKILLDVARLGFRSPPDFEHEATIGDEARVLRLRDEGVFPPPPPPSSTSGRRGRAGDRRQRDNSSGHDDGNRDRSRDRSVDRRGGSALDPDSRSYPSHDDGVPVESSRILIASKL